MTKSAGISVSPAVPGTVWDESTLKFYSVYPRSYRAGSPNPHPDWSSVASIRDGRWTRPHFL